MCATAALRDGALPQRQGLWPLYSSVWRRRSPPLGETTSSEIWTCAPEFSGTLRMHGSMQNVAPVINHAHRGGTLRLAFLSAVVSLVVSLPRRPRRSPCTTSTGGRTGSPAPASRWPSSATPGSRTQAMALRAGSQGQTRRLKGPAHAFRRATPSISSAARMRSRDASAPIAATG
jgi:hypothetical protein